MVGELTWRKRLLGLWAPLALFSVVALFPFTWMAATSLKTNAELYDPKAMPLTIRHPSLVHYISLLQETNFLTWIANTMLVAAVATGISLLLGTMLAYPLARMRFRGAPLLAITVAVTYLVPQSLRRAHRADRRRGRADPRRRLLLGPADGRGAAGLRAGRAHLFVLREVLRRRAHRRRRQGLGRRLSGLFGHPTTLLDQRPMAAP